MSQEASSPCYQLRAGSACCPRGRRGAAPPGPRRGQAPARDACTPAWLRRRGRSRSRQPFPTQHGFPCSAPASRAPCFAEALQAFLRGFSAPPSRQACSADEPGPCPVLQHAHSFSPPAAPRPFPAAGSPATQGPSCPCTHRPAPLQREQQGSPPFLKELPESSPQAPPASCQPNSTGAAASQEPLPGPCTQAALPKSLVLCLQLSWGL